MESCGRPYFSHIVYGNAVFTVVLYAMVSLFQITMVCHGFPVLKQGNRAMVSLFLNTMVCHGFPVSKHHGMPWFP